MPCIAFFNSGVALSGLRADWFVDPVAGGIIAALIVGKPLGVALGTYCALRAGVGRLPAGTTLRDTIGAALFAGIGFTMSLFIATAAFDDPMRAGSRQAFCARWFKPFRHSRRVALTEGRRMRPS